VPYPRWESASMLLLLVMLTPFSVSTPVVLSSETLVGLVLLSLMGF
jgi:hypothetical protein